MTKAYFETLAVFAGMILAIATVFFVGVSAVFIVNVVRRIIYFRQNPPYVNTFRNVAALVIVYAWSDIWN